MVSFSFGTKICSMMGWKNRETVSVAWGDGQQLGLAKVETIKPAARAFRLTHRGKVCRSLALYVAEMPPTYSGADHRHTPCSHEIINDKEGGRHLIIHLPKNFHKSPI